MKLALAPGYGFSMGLPPEVLARLAGKHGEFAVTATVAGGALPGWLVFDPGTVRLLSKEIPPGVLPVTVLLRGANGATVEVTFQ